MLIPIYVKRDDGEYEYTLMTTAQLLEFCKGSVLDEDGTLYIPGEFTKFGLEDE